MFQVVKVKRHKKIGTTQRTTGMTGLTGVNHAYDIPSDLGSDFFQFIIVRCLAHAKDICREDE